MKKLHSILISRTCILFALVCILIPGCYFADNYIDLAYAFTTQKLSVLYFFSVRILLPVNLVLI